MAASCWAILCFVVLAYVMFCQVMLCCVVLRHVLSELKHKLNTLMLAYREDAPQCSEATSLSPAQELLRDKWSDGHLEVDQLNMHKLCLGYHQ